MLRDPYIRFDSNGDVEISDSAGIWYKFIQRKQHMQIVDSVQTETGEMIYRLGRRYRNSYYEVFTDDLGVYHDSWLNGKFYETYNAKVRMLLLYISRPDRNGNKSSPKFLRALPDSIVVGLDAMYRDSVFLIKAKNAGEYMIIPDCYWNQNDVWNCAPIRLFDDSLNIKDSGYRYFDKTVYIPTDMDVVNDWQTVYVNDKNDPSAYTAYLKRRGNNR